MFAFNPFIGVLAKSFNLFRKNFSGWVDSLRSALPIPGISGVTTKALGRLGLFGWYEVLRITLVAGRGRGIRPRLGRESWLVVVGAPAPGANLGHAGDAGVSRESGSHRGGAPTGREDAMPFINVAMMA